MILYLRKLCFAFTLAAFTIPAHADDDPWFGADKGIHFGASAAMAAVGYGAFSIKLEEPWQRALAGSALSLTIGSLKELADATNGSVASWRDMTWNIAGTMVGAGISMGIDLLFFTGNDKSKENAYQLIIEPSHSYVSVLVTLPIG